MKRFLFKFFFVLMALIAAIPAQAATIYFKNTVGWSTVYVHFYSAESWHTEQGAGFARSEHVSVTPMKIIDGTDIYSCECTGDYSVVAFTKEEQKGYYSFHNNEVVYLTDFSTSKPLFTPDNNQHTDINNCKYYNVGTWSEYSEPLQTQLDAPTFSLAEGEYTSAQTVTISAAEGATIYYTTDKSDPTTSSTEYSEPITVSETTTIRAIAVKDGYTNSEIAEATYTINSTTPTKYTYALHGQITGNTQRESTAMTDEGNGIWSLTGNFVVGEFGIKKMDADGQVANGWLGWPYIGSPADNCVQSGNNIKLTVAGNYTISFNTKTEKITVTKNSTSTGEIPVYPNGVSTESELAAYNFEANPVYYLVAQVLNDERPTPEWQMEKGADGKYHINGFAMRNTNCIGYDNTYVDGVAVRQYTSANSYIDLDKQTLNDLPSSHLSEGHLFNATFDPETGKLTFEEDPSANHKMPFISLVGYMMQQDAEYATPRGVEGTPAGVTTAKGWQEAWLQYDAEGNLLKDRKGNVMYSTMWPPKNPVYFTANAGGERHYSSDQMTFSPVKAAGKYVAKTGAEWEAELKASDNANADAYQGLDLVDNATYYRYVVDDIWYVGAGKIWTGWAGQTVKRDGREVAQWSNHRNWGYGNKKATDTDGTSIKPETTYGVSTEEGANGNFLFEQPTFFKTIEFFYDNNDPEKASKIYTTRAYGSASIAAQSNKDKKDGAHKKGSYQPSVSVPEGVTVTGYTIYRYDATTNQLAPIGDDGGKVAEGTTDPNSTEFTFDKEGLADGRYYYVLKVDFSNDRSSKVRSNPFIIYHPGVYTLDANGYQLVKLDNPVNDYEYVTYNSKENGEMYLVNIANDAVTAYEVLPTDKRDEVKALLSSNEGIKWTDKVFVYAPVPSSFKIDAEKDNSTINLEDITGYTLGTTTVAPFNANAKELVKLDNTGNFAQRTYKAVMNYKETDPNTKEKTPKSTLGKENITMMQMPNVKAKGSVVTVTKIANSKELDIIDGDVTKQKACNYYEVTLALNFDDPNVITAKAPRFKIGDKVYEGVNAGTRSIKIACVNPLDFANAADITVDAVYYDGTSYTLPATIGEAAVLKADDAKFQVLAHPLITSVHAITSKMLGKNVVAVIGMSTTMKGDADKIGETDLDDEYYNVEFAIDEGTNPDFSQILTKDDINFTGVLEDKGDYKIWSKFHWFENTTGKNNMKLRAEVTPMYVAHVTNQASTENLQIISGETPATAEGTYVALNGITADYTIEGSIQTGVTDINTLAPRARKVIENGEIHIICGDRKYNVMGAEIR